MFLKSKGTLFGTNGKTCSGFSTRNRDHTLHGRGCYGRNSSPVSRVLYPSICMRAFVIYLRYVSPRSSIVLPSDTQRQSHLRSTAPYKVRESSEQLSNIGLRELSTSHLHGTHVAMRPVSSYLTFSPLPAYAGGCFLLQTFALADDFPLRSGLLFVARTFLLPTTCGKRQTVGLFLFTSAKLRFFFVIGSPHASAIFLDTKNGGETTRRVCKTTWLAF